jgi:multidrug resistance efflux pump
MENENKAIESKYNGSSRKKLMVLAAIGFAVALIIALVYLFLSQNFVYVEKSSIEAPMIGLSSQNGGILQKLYVSEGDTVSADEVVAEIGNELIKSKESGIVIAAQNNIGKNLTPGEAAVTVINPSELRLVAQIEENKGLNDIEIGQRVFFTVDTFGSKQYEGVVDEVTPTSRQSDIVFNISSQRQEQEFNIKVRFDIEKYPELKNGMSAKAWIYKN